jgi:hypothetical protein
MSVLDTVPLRLLRIMGVPTLASPQQPPHPTPKPNRDHLGLARSDKGQFVKGSGGRPKGFKNAKPFSEIKVFAAEVLLGDDPHKYLKNVARRIMAGEAPHMEKFFAEHLWGKPKEQIEHTGSVDLVHLLSERLIQAKERAREQRQLAS